MRSSDPDAHGLPDPGARGGGGEHRGDAPRPRGGGLLSGTCRRAINDFTPRPDGMHFQDRGATWAARWLLDRIEVSPR